MPENLYSPLRVAWVSSYVPKRCGIATFSRDLIDGIELADPTIQISIAAAEGENDELTYGPRVVGTTHTSSPASFTQAGRILATADPDVLVIQHEFGLFGGARTNFERDGKVYHYPTGDNIFKLIDTVRRPVVATLHTVLPDPDPERRQAIRDLAERSTILVTMTSGGKRVLADKYDIPTDKVVVIPHGVPSVTPVDGALAKAALGLPVDEPIMMITGLIGGNKGINIAINALPEILTRYPKLKLYVVGQTHPDILAHSGETYRESLMKQAQDLGVADNLVFVNKYLPVEELVKYLQAADLYLTLHGDPEQAASGTLAYAMGAGLVAISTPYRYAEEMLAGDRGILVPFGDAPAFARAVVEVLADPKRFADIKLAASSFGASMSWPIVGRSYAELIHAVAREEVPKYS